MAKDFSDYKSPATNSMDDFILGESGLKNVITNVMTPMLGDYAAKTITGEFSKNLFSMVSLQGMKYLDIQGFS